MMKRKKAFTLVEMLAVIAVVGIITAGSYMSLNRTWRNNQTDICESDLRSLSGGFSSYFVDYGNIVIPNDINYNNVLDGVVNTLNRSYLSNEIVVTAISSDKKNVELTTKTKKDPWGNKYVIDVYTYNGADKESVPGLVIIYSKGVDGVSSLSNYKNGNYGDDVVAVVEPK